MENEEKENEKKDDKEDVGRKLLFSAVDKLIIGGIAALVALIFQFKSHESKKLLDESITVSKVYTEILVDQRKSLVDSLKNYFLLIEDIKPAGIATEAQANKLMELLHNFRLIVFIISVDATEIKKDGDNFLKSIEDMNMKLVSEITPKVEVEERTKEIKKCYKSVLDTLKELTIEKVREEFAGAKPKEKYFDLFHYYPSFAPILMPNNK